MRGEQSKRGDERGGGHVEEAGGLGGRSGDQNKQGELGVGEAGCQA